MRNDTMSTDHEGATPRWIAVPSRGLLRRSWQAAVHLRQGEGMQSHSVESHYCEHRHRSRRAAQECADRLLAEVKR
jgi:hypothetical protein